MNRRLFADHEHHFVFVEHCFDSASAGGMRGYPRLVCVTVTQMLDNSGNKLKKCNNAHNRQAKIE